MKDRVPSNPGRVLVTPENGGAAYYATLTRADNPTQEGTPLNKANLLTDATAALFGLDANAVPNDVFSIVHTLIARNAMDIANGVKIEAGSYTGTDETGEANAITLTFGFEPKMVIVQNASDLTLDFLPMIKEVSQTGDDTANGSSSSAVHVTWGTNSVSWYSDHDKGSMKNAANNTYYYIAIG